MSRFQRSSFWFAFILIVTAGLGRAQNIVQEFFIPLPEEQVRGSLLKLFTSTGTTFDSVISVVISSDGTKFVYDHWEDGYEVDLDNPVQSTTQVWGDGNNANGIPPGFVNDPAGLPVGTVLPLRNLVTLPRNPSQIRYDGRDRIGATKAVVVSRAAWATSPGSVLAGAVEVSSVLDYGTEFFAPVGENVSASQMFEVVDLFVMAAENGTTVNIDKDANGSFETVANLNRGESYRVNGGVLRGARVVANKPIQAHLITGDIGANYESRWYTLYPFEQWTDTYYTPVGSAANGHETYIFAYNPGTSALPVQVTTQIGTTNLSVAANGSVQYLMPVNSGAKFQSTNGAPFFAIATVGARPSANNVHDWGFSLVPEGNLTPIAQVGWGPGSSDLSQNGSPVWVTAVGATTLYVDYNGDKLGPFTDSNGDGYDISYPMALLQSRTIYDPDKDQTGMRIYTLDGTLITAAWGQDPAVAGAGNPFLDLGTTVLPFPEAVIRKTSTLIVDNPPAGISTNDILEYAITIDNNSLVVLGNVIVLDTPPPSLLYITNSASRDFVAVPDDVLPDTLFPFDEGGYVIPIVPRGGSTTLRYHARILSSGTIANGATLGGDTVVVTNIVEVPPPEGAAACNLAFTDGSGAPIIAYSAGSSIYVTLNDADANTDTSVVNTIAVNVQNLSNGDVETITLSELSANTNVFRNLIALPSSTSSGLLTQDGTLNVGPGHTLSVSYTDPVFNDFCSDTVLISTPSETKVLYLSTDGSGSPDQDLDRIDPVASGDSTTATSVVLSASSSAITVLNTTSRGTNEGASALTTLVIPHVTSNAANRLMLVGFSAEDDNTGSLSVTNVRYVAVGVTQTMTRVFARASSQEAEMELWSLIAPTIGSGTVTVFMADGNANDGDAVYVGVTTFSGVNQTTPFRTTNTAVGTTSPASVIVTSAVNDLVFDLMALDDARSATAISGQTVLWNEIVGSAANDGVRASASVRDGAAPRVTNSWTISADSWVSGGVSIQPAQLEHMSSTSVTSLTGNISVPHVVGSGDNRLMMVGVSWKPDGNTNITVARVRSGNTTNALTLVGTRLGNDQQVNIYSLLAPSVGSATVDVTFAAAHKGAVVGVSTFAGVNQSTPLGAFASNTGDSTAPSVSVVSAADDLVFDTVTVEKDATLSVGPAQVSRWLTAGNVNEVRGGGSTEVASNLTTTMSWTLSTSKKWVIGGVAIKPAPAGGGNSPTATFTQTPVLCSDLELPAGGVVTVTNFIAVTSGSMPANPDITAVLRYGATVVATMNPPTYTAANSNLTWTAVIPSDVTVPAGEALSLDVQSAEAGVVFHLLYDSSNKPSKISLPVTTVISVDSVAVYDAPYPGGSIVPSANNGNTLYIRTTVSDPFGAYDITGLDLDIDGPGVADDVFVSLNDANVVASNACSKTYEYVWNTGATEGNYSIAATAHEGSEGITDTRATSIPLSSLDLGTPCSIAFTFGDNGPATNQFATNATICVRVTDLDQNTNSLTVDTLFAVLTSSSGDVEPLVLTETATNSGIFTACIPSSALPGFVSSNGVISAPAGSLLALDYVDPDDPTDPCSAVAVVPAAPGTPGLSLTKTLIAPADGQAVLGEGIQFRLRAVNTGSTVLNPVSVTDTFANVHMAYNFATPTPNSVGAGSLVWTNIGPMSPGDTVDIFVNFTALSVADPSTNIAIANAGGGVVSTGTSTVIISDPAITVNKVVLSPVPGPAPKGSDVVFQITITNVGSSAVTVLPLEDTYSGACFSFVSASPSPDGTGFGSLLWDDLTGAGSLAPGGSITVLVTLAATGGCNPAENVSPISYAVDEYGDPVPPVTSSATITTVAARISGFVYNDIDQSGTFTGGDVGLGGVTVRLFTDPNGDGDPSDGTLVGLLTTLANGSYEFLNLGTGTYVVVETDPLSFVSTGDTAGPNDNRIPVAVVSFISYDGNNFFDAQFPAIVVQKTVNGQELVLGTNGTPVTYAFVVSNPGSITLTNVTLTDAALGFTTNVGSLIIGQSKTVSVAGVISADLTNVVNATGFYFGTGTVNDTDTAIVDLIAPAIEVVKTVNGVSLVQGTNNAPVTYAFVVSNAGDVALTNVVVTDPLLSFTTNVGTLAVGQSVTVSVDSVISGDLTNTVAVTGEDPNGDEYADEDTAEVDLIAPAIGVEKTVNGVELVQGTNNTPVTYAFVVSNEGDVALTNVVVNDPLLSFTTNVGTLAVGQSVTVEVASVISGDLTNTVAVTGEDPNGDEYTDEDTAEVDLIAPAITIDNTVNGVELVQGTNNTPVTYAFVVSNAGDVTLTNVVVTNAALGFTTNLGTLAVGQSVTVEVASVISADLVNSAVATGEDPVGGIVTDDDPSEVDLITPAIGVEKTVNGVELVQGTNGTPVTYAFVVSNEGDVALTNVVVNDAALSFTTNVGTLAVGQSVTVEVASVISGDLTNTVTVTGEDPNGDEYTDEDTAEVDLIAPAISVEKTVNGVELVQGTNNTPVTYAFVVSNEGDVALTNVVVNDTALSFTTNVGTLAVGQSVTVSVNSVISSDLTNTVDVTGEDPNGDEYTDEDTAEVDLIAPAINVEKTVNGVELVQGTNNTPVTYAFVVSNEGDVALTNVVVNDPLLSFTTNVGTLAVGQSITVEVASVISGDLTNTVTVTGEDPNGDEYTDEDDAEVDLIAPAITIDNTVNGVELVQGTNNTPVTYAFVVSNAGDVTLTNVVVTNAALGFTTNLGTLAVGQSVTVEVASVISGDLTNSAVATGEDPVGGIVTDDDPSEVDLIAPAIGVEKTVNGVELVQGTNGTPVTYAFVVSNDGDVTLTNVVVNDPLLSFTTNVGTLAVGQSVTVEVASVISGDLTNTVAVTGEDPNGDEYADEDTAEVDLIAPAINVEKTVNGVELVQGTNNTPVTYAFVVSNEGDVALTNVVVDDALLSFTTNVGTLAVGQSVTVEVASVISGDLTNTVAVTGEDPNGDEYTDEDTAEVDLIAPAITIDNTVNGVELVQGTNNTPVTYAFVVSNAGDVTLTNVVVTNAALGFTTNLGTLAVGQSVTVEVASVISGDLTNSAVATGEDPVGGIVTDDDPSEVDLIAPAISVEKTVNGVELVQGTNGTPVTYAFVVSNEGDVALTNVVVNDAALSFTTNVGTLAVGQSVTVEVASVISGDLTNTVTVTGEDPNGDEYTDEDTAEVDLIAPAINVEKTVNGVELVQGTNNTPVTYAFVVSNEGDVALTNVVVDDALLSFTTNVGTLAVGQSVTVEVASVISGDLTNTVTVTGEDPNGGEYTDEDTAEVDLIAPAITIDNTVNGVELVQGTNNTPVTYAFVVSNAGDVTLTNVVVTNAALGFTTNLGTLAVGQGVTVEVASVISADLVNSAVATGEDPVGGIVTDDDPSEVDLIAPAIGVEKTVNGVELVQGTNNTPVTYAFVVSNEGDVALTNVVVNDPLLSFTTNVGTLAVGQSVTVEVASVISGDLTNTVAVTGEDPNGDEYTEEDDAEVDLIAPAITIDNTVNGVELVQGTNNTPVTYAFVVSNSGDVTLTNVVVTNAALGFTTNLGTLAVGQSVTVEVASVISADLVNSAVATGEDPVGGIVTDDDPSEVDLIAPAIGVEKTVNGVELVQGTNGTPVTYAFVVSNAGDVALTNVVVNDPQLTFTTNVGTLAVGQSVTVEVASVISGDLTNTVTVTGEDPNGDEYTDDDTAEVDLIAPAINVEKTVNGVELVQGTNNTPVTYAFVVSNEGDVALTNVVVNDPLLSFTTNVGTLAVGQSITVEVASVISGDLTNTVTVTGEDPNGDEYTDEDSAEVDLIAPAITIDNTVNGVELVQGTNNTPVTYAFVVRNSGDVTLTNVVVTNSALGFTTNLGTLAVGQSVTVEVASVISGDLVNSVVATGEDPVGGIVTDDDPSEVDLIAPAINVEKTVNGVELVQGTNNTPVTYAFVVSNEGDVALTNVVVNDPLLSFTTNVGTLAVGQSVTVEVASVISGDLTNTVTVTGEDPNGDEYADEDEAEVDLIAPAIGVVKTVNGVSFVQGTNNTPVTYAFVVSNEGDVALTNVLVDDALLSFTTNVGTLAVGQSITVEVASVISGDLTNTVTVTGEDPNGDEYTDEDSAEVGVLMAIRGFVLDDINGDGLFDPEDTNGLAGVTITLYDASTSVVAVTTTDGNGAYAFTNIPSGAYTVVETDPAGYISTGDTSGPNDNEIPVVLAGGVDSVGNNFLDTRPGTIGNFVWVDVNGDGLQAGGSETGLPDVVVTLYNTNGVVIAVTTSDVTGAYAFTNVPPAFYVLGFEPPMGYQFTAPNVGIDDALDSDPDPLSGLTATIQLLSAQIDLSLDAGFFLPGSIGEQVFEDANYNSVLDPGEITSLVTGLTVNLYLSDNTFVTSTVTDASGVYLFTNLPPGSYIVEFLKPTNLLFVTPFQGGDPALDSDANQATGRSEPIVLVSGEDNRTVGAGLARFGALGDFVWWDLNNNGEHDENLAFYGLNGVKVRLYRVSGSSTTLVDTATTATDTNGQKGAYFFPDLEFGDYLVVVDTNDLPSYLRRRTTGLNYLVTISPEYAFFDADFGFNTDPTPITLRSFRAVRDGESVRLEWETVSEFENLGYHLYRAADSEGERTRITPELILGQGTGNGATYFYTDAAAPEGTAWNYWLEDISWQFESTLHGPVQVNEGSDDERAVDVLVGAFDLEAGSAGLYRITQEALVAAGIPSASLDVASLKIALGGAEVALLPIAEGEILRPGESLLFFVPELKEGTSVNILTGPDARRMGWAYAEPRGEGEVWTGVVRTDGQLPFTVTHEWQRYLLMGFERGDALVLDVSDPLNPRVLFDYAVLDIPGQSGIYLSLVVEESADCIAIQLESIREVPEVRAP